MNDHTRRINEARLKYKPDVIKCLFIAEAPTSDEERFFYFEDVPDHDSLYLELMKSLFTTYSQGTPDPMFDFVPVFKNSPSTYDLRSQKADYLSKFKDMGFYLIDCLDHPLPYNLSTNEKINKLNPVKNDLVAKVKSLIDKRTPVILISLPVYQAMAGSLKYNGYNVINKCGVPFPGSGQQQNFHDAMRPLLPMLKINQL